MRYGAEMQRQTTGHISEREEGTKKEEQEIDGEDLEILMKEIEQADQVQNEEDELNKLGEERENHMEKEWDWEMHNDEVDKWEQELKDEEKEIELWVWNSWGWNRSEQHQENKEVGPSMEKEKRNGINKLGEGRQRKLEEYWNVKEGEVGEKEKEDRGWGEYNKLLQGTYKELRIPIMEKQVRVIAQRKRLIP